MVDGDIVASKLRSVNQYTDELKEMRGISEERYVENTVRQRAVERTFVILIQSCIDLAGHIRSTEGLSPGGTSKKEMEALGNAGIISSDTQAKMVEAVGFRNVLAHRYGNVDHGIVYDVLHEDLRWFERFQQEVAQWFQQHEQ